ncbi:YheC/YheD family protein [Bacillus marinisedimentorum]|uniref:YheC/YheD family endospore coat-associated protein n=1 Tax=Bacillus marinisedimentorum TaxID=1821260 RepID=UPI0007E22383|nr:YheC/YheD family protein [Bacillus marinisedimentorum]
MVTVVHARYIKREPAAFSSGNQLHLTEPFAQRLKITGPSAVHIQTGTASAAAVPVIMNGDGYVFSVSPGLQKELGLPDETLNIRINYSTAGRTFKIGPFIAVLADKTYPGADPPCGKLSAYYEELSVYARDQHIGLYITSPEYWDVKQMKGMIYSGGSWKQNTVPAPDIVHNRISSRRFEQTEAFNKIREYCTRHEIPFFNHQFLNKWNVKEMLEKCPEIVPYLPETALLNSRSALRNMLLKHERVYLKPIHGSQGRDIFMVFLSEEGFVLHSTSSSPAAKAFQTVEDLFDEIVPAIKKERYLVQEGLTLISRQSSPLDFRFLCHQISAGKWIVTSETARLSPPGHFVSNIAMGGSLVRPLEVLKDVFGNKHGKELLLAMREIAVNTAAAISSEAGGTYAELGLDIAADTDGKPWIIEVNTKPSKDMSAVRPGNSTRPSARAIIDISRGMASV